MRSFSGLGPLRRRHLGLDAGADSSRPTVRHRRVRSGVGIAANIQSCNSRAELPANPTRRRRDHFSHAAPFAGTTERPAATDHGAHLRGPDDHPIPDDQLSPPTTLVTVTTTPSTADTTTTTRKRRGDDDDEPDDIFDLIPIL